jgi:nucleotide-binding universal stress UspA family protein
VSGSSFLLGIFLTWAAIGVVSAVVMGRRGHATFSWLIVGAFLGPLVVPLASSRTRQARQLPRAADVGTRRGPVDVLVGVDGSAESLAAATIVARLLGDRVGRLTVAIVIDYDTALGGAQGPAHRAASLELSRAADAVSESVPNDVDTAMLAGKPADALVAHATAGQYDVIAVGSRGRGATKLMMGSVATRLSRGAPVPVLVVSNGGRLGATT